MKSHKFKTEKNHKGPNPWSQCIKEVLKEIPYQNSVTIFHGNLLENEQNSLIGLA